MVPASGSTPYAKENSQHEQTLRDPPQEPKRTSGLKSFIADIFRRRTDQRPPADLSAGSEIRPHRSGTSGEPEKKEEKKVRVRSLMLPKDTDIVSLYQDTVQGSDENTRKLNRARDKRRLSLSLGPESSLVAREEKQPGQLMLDDLSSARSYSIPSASSRSASTPKSSASTPKSTASTPKSTASTPKSTASTPKSDSSSSPSSLASPSALLEARSGKLEKENSDKAESKSAQASPPGNSDAQFHCKEKLLHIRRILDEQDRRTPLAPCQRHKTNLTLVLNENHLLEWKETNLISDHSGSTRKALRFILAAIQEAIALDIEKFEDPKERNNSEVQIVDLMTACLENKQVQKKLAKKNSRPLRNEWVRLHLRNYFLVQMKEAAAYQAIWYRMRPSVECILEAISSFQTEEIAKIKKEYLEEKDIKARTLGWLSREKILAIKDRLLLGNIYSDDQYELFALTLKNLIFEKPDNVVGFHRKDACLPFSDFFGLCSKNCKEFEEEAKELAKEDPDGRDLVLEHYIKRSKKLKASVKETALELFKAHGYTGCIRALAPELDHLIAFPRQGFYLMIEQLGVRGIDLLEMRGMKKSEGNKLRMQLSSAILNKQQDVIAETIETIGRKMAGFPRAEAGLHASVDLFIALKRLKSPSPLKEILAFLESSDLFSLRNSAIAKLTCKENTIPLVEDQRKVLEAFVEIIGDNFLRPHPAFLALMEYLLSAARENARSLAIDPNEITPLLEFLKTQKGEFPWELWKRNLKTIRLNLGKFQG